MTCMDTMTHKGTKFARKNSMKPSPFLGAFAKLRKTTISYIMSVCLSVSLSVCLSVCPHATSRLPLDGFSWNFIFEDFRTSVENTQILLKSDKNNGYFAWRPMYIYDISLRSSQSEKCFRQNLQKISTHVLISNNYFFQKLCRLWDNAKKYGRARHATYDNIIRRMRFACWITKATDSHSECVTLIVFPRQQWLRERAWILRLYVHCLTC
jgi:hypothetical protein